MFDSFRYECYNGCGRLQIVCTLRHFWFDKLVPVLQGLMIGALIGAAIYYIQNYMTVGGL